MDNRYKLMSFSFKASKRKREVNSNKPKVISKLINGICIKTPDGFKAKIKEEKNCKILDFTEQSKKLEGKELIFSKNKDKYGHYVCQIRDKNKAYIVGGNEELFTPFREGYVIYGYIVLIDNIEYFDMRRISTNKLDETYILEI